MSYDRNPYYNPEKIGLVKVAEADLSEPDYSFDILAVWADDEGFYLGTDSGCSCPTPFEDYNGKSDMTGPLTLEQVIEESESIKRASWQPDYDMESWGDFLTIIHNYAKEN